MTTAQTAWPRKTRDLHNHHMDSTVWNEFKFRDGDIVIATVAKSGTTWTQQIVSQLVFNGSPDVAVAELSPWIDLRIPPRDVKLPAIEAQTHRRFVKTHLPVDALVYSPKAKYIFIGRDGRDVVWSLYNHHANANDKWFQAINDTPGRIGPPVPRAGANIREYFLPWLEGDGTPFWPFFSSVKSWWDIRGLPNLHFVHFENLKRDLPGEIRKLAKFLDIAIDDNRFPKIVEHCSFDWMKKNATKAAPLGGAFWDGGAETFINKGTNGRWRDVLTAADNRRYEAEALAKLGPECARWLATGGMAP